MLCITRRQQQEILIRDKTNGGEIRLVFAKCRKDQTKICIEADRRFEILRTELLRNEEELK